MRTAREPLPKHQRQSLMMTFRAREIVGCGNIMARTAGPPTFHSCHGYCIGARLHFEKGRHEYTWLMAVSAGKALGSMHGLIKNHFSCALAFVEDFAAACRSVCVSRKRTKNSKEDDQGITCFLPIFRRRFHNSTFLNAADQRPVAQTDCVLRSRATRDRNGKSLRHQRPDRKVLCFFDKRLNHELQWPYHFPES